MSLTPGTKLGAYEILAAIGAGGMGEAYRARDNKLGREVAIKVLPAEFTQHPQKLARFEREARLLAALNHPGIATLHGLEEAEGKPFLVMELVDGEILAEPPGTSPQQPVAVSAPSRARERLVWGRAILVASITIWSVMRPGPRLPTPLTVALPPGDQLAFDCVVLSAEGRDLVYLGTRDGTTQLYRRPPA